jgi:hypothetical protein
MQYGQSISAWRGTYYADGEGRSSIQPGVYFRMLFVG